MRSKLFVVISLLFIVILLALSFYSRIKDPIYFLRLEDYRTRLPITNKEVILIPRVIYGKMLPGAGDPNWKFAITEHATDEGLVYLRQSQLDKLFSNFFDKRGGIIDCKVKGFSRFTIEYNKIYLLTVFTKEGRVRPSGNKRLTKDRTVIIYLDKL